MVQTRAATKRIEAGEKPVLPSPAKKRRVEGEESPKKRRRGKRSELCQLNLDVLFLLAAYIQPLDLLNLARTCKSLRELLMDKSSEFVWKTARRQVGGFPDCPADLTEPEYANLAFHARCHGCGKVARKIFWKIRRRYCAECRPERLCNFQSCPYVLRCYSVLHHEYLDINGEKGQWVDIEQKNVLVHAYDNAPDKDKFLAERRTQLFHISQHALLCQYWEKRMATDRRNDLYFRREAREESIFERIKQHGYEPEVDYFGQHTIQQTHKAFFRTSKPLTDQEWDLMWPEWVVTMNGFRSRRLENVVYRPRRGILVHAYDGYVKVPTLDEPAVELLPDLMDLRSFKVFRDIITAPEGTEMGLHPFEPAFAQLPALAKQWKVQLDNEFATSIAIPSQLTVKDMSSPRGGTSSSKTLSGVPQAPTGKLRLACALFRKGDHVAPYPEILFLPTPSHIYGACDEGDPDGTVSLQIRLRIEFLEEAPYIVHACGLDPNVATAEDMDRRNARLKCLTCNDSWVMNWRNAVQHAFSWCPRKHMPPPMAPPRYELVSDEHIDAIQAAEASFKNGPPTLFRRCLLCRPCVGNALDAHQIEGHLVHRHDIKRDDIQQDVHHTPVGLHCARWRMTDRVKMVEEGGRITFSDWASHQSHAKT